MTKHQRFIIEGTWSGYRSSQQRVVHRTVHKGNRKKLRAWAEETHGIGYTDGTMLYLTVRDCKPREKVKEIKGYVELINRCFTYDVTSVAQVNDLEAQWDSEMLEECSQCEEGDVRECPICGCEIDMDGDKPPHVHMFP